MDNSTYFPTTITSGLRAEEANMTCEEIIAMYFTGQERHWITSLFCVYFVLGFFGNGILVVLFLKHKKLRDVNNSFVTNLAFSDFLFVGVWVPIKIFEEYHKFRPFGKTACYISILINYTSQDVSTMSLTAMSYFRYCAVTQPIQSRSKKQRSIWLIPSLCVAMWVVGALGGLFVANYCIEEEIDCLVWKRSIVHSFDEPKKHLIFHCVRFVVFYIVPLILISVFYGKMAFHLFKDTSVLKRNASISARRASRSRKKLGVIVLVIVAIFFVSWLPNYISWIQGLSNEHLMFVPWLLNMRIVCMFIPSTLNPVILFITSTGYRKYFLETFVPCHPSNEKKLGFKRSQSLTSSIRVSFSRFGNLTSLSRLSPDGGTSPDHTVESNKLEQSESKIK